MAGKGKHNGPARKKAAELQEPQQQPAEKPAAQKQAPIHEIVDMNELIDCVVEGAKSGARTVRMTRAECLAKYGYPGNMPDPKGQSEVGAKYAAEREATQTNIPASAKPSEEAEELRKIIGTLPTDPSTMDLNNLAAAIVRRFPGLTRKPGVPRHDREDTLLAKRGRLPDGSIVLAVWDEAAGVWAGQLVTKPAVGLAGMLRDMVLRSGEHHATSWPGLFGLLKKLDRLYRDQVGRQKGGGK